MSIFNSLKLNWHFINNCNMHCKFCYASKDSCNINSFKIAEKLKPFKYINLVGGDDYIQELYSFIALSKITWSYIKYSKQWFYLFKV
ncbi:hypothetical protein [Brachyspira sp.]|uniref:hypothetical protein n=1 Tax=Brachyspira sp. TaxID=1977261 RepID=UPI00260A153E|nr:hypothetical protein [Brachyspira sp.]